VLKQAQAELLNWNGTGISVMEMSHRGKPFVSITEQAEADMRELLKIPDNFKVFWFQGGASMQFSAMCYNLLKEGETANYVTTGSWSEAAIKEAKKYCNPNEVTNNKKHKYATVDDPSTWNVDPTAKFFHYCKNETIQGLEFHEFPYHVVPENQLLISDMSSDFCSKPIDWEKHAMVYAGAQKNVGPSGVCITIIREDLIGEGNMRPDTPMLCDWHTYDKAMNTFQNTPTCWSIYMAGLNLKYMRERGMEAIQAEAVHKSGIFYDYMENSNGFYLNPVDAKYRSCMNIPFRVQKNGKPNEELEKKFLGEATAAGCIDLKGHRSVGGLRASIYNAMPEEGVKALMDFMTKFKNENN
jgi:phosphoserine aminotransferase